MDYYAFDIDGSRELTPLVNFSASDYIPEPYTPPRSIASTHNQPRFGRTNDFETLINGTNDDIQDYIIGIILGAMIILIVAILWFFVIVCLKVAGRKRVGFFAGRLVRPVASSASSDGSGGGKGDGVEVVMAGNGQEDNNDVDEAVPVDTAAAASNTVDKKFKRRVWFVRGVFVISGLMVIAAGGLFYGKGVAAFKDSLDEVRQGIEFVQDAANKAISLTEDVLQAGDDMDSEMEPSREVSITNDGQICGLDTEASNKIREVYDALNANVVQLQDMLSGSLEDFGHDLRMLVKLTEDINDSLDSADAFFYCLIAISVIIIVLIVAMLVGVFFASKGISNCFTKLIQYTIIWPLFVFFLLLSWIFATLFLIASLAGADFCISPDKHVQAILNNEAANFDGIIFGFIIFYVSGCTIIPAGEEDIIAIANQLKLVTTHAHGLVSLLGELPIERIRVICGLTIEQAAALKSVVNLGHDSTHVLNRAVVGLRDVLSCETFNPIYTTFVHEAFCIEGVSGLTYIFATTLVISIFSMVMIMFRAAMYPIKEPSSAAAGSEDEMEVVEYNENGNAPKNDNGDEKAQVY